MGSEHAVTNKAGGEGWVAGDRDWDGDIEWVAEDQASFVLQLDIVLVDVETRWTRTRLIFAMVVRDTWTILFVAVGEKGRREDRRVFPNLAILGGADIFLVSCDLNSEPPPPSRPSALESSLLVVGLTMALQSRSSHRTAV